MKITKKILISSLVITPLTTLAFVPSIVRNTNLKQYSLNSEEDIVFFSPKKENFIGLPKFFKYCKVLFEPKTLKAFPLWCFVERLDSFDGVHYFNDYATHLSKVFGIKYDDIVPNDEEANYVNVSQFIKKKLKEIEKQKIETKDVDFILKDYVDDVEYYSKSKQMFYENIKAYLKNIENEIRSQLLKFEVEYKDIVLKEKKEYIEKLKEELNWIENLIDKLIHKSEHSGIQNSFTRKWEEINYFKNEERKLKTQLSEEEKNLAKIKLIEYKI